MNIASAYQRAYRWRGFAATNAYMNKFLEQPPSNWVLQEAVNDQP